MNDYIEKVIATVERRDNAKPEYIQCVKEVFRSLEAVIEQHPEYVEDDLLQRMANRTDLLHSVLHGLMTQVKRKSTEVIVFSSIRLSVRIRADFVFIRV